MALTSLTRVKANTIGSANVATLANMADLLDVSNTKNKYEGKIIRVSDNNKLASSMGTDADALWHYADGTLAATPV